MKIKASMDAETGISYLWTQIWHQHSNVQELVHEKSFTLMGPEGPDWGKTIIKYQILAGFQI